MDQLFGSESGLVFENSTQSVISNSTSHFNLKTKKYLKGFNPVLNHLECFNQRFTFISFHIAKKSEKNKMMEKKEKIADGKDSNIKKKILRFFTFKKITQERKSEVWKESFFHIYCTQLLQKTKENFKTFSHLSFIGKDCHKLPPIIPNRYGSKVDTLDLSFNRLTTLQGVECFIHLKELILDNNNLSDNIVIPKMEFLQTFSINKNKLINLEVFLEKVQSNLPSLKYLSLLGNKACPNQLSDYSKDEDDYKRYRFESFLQIHHRYYVINRLPNLQFLDSTPVTLEEKAEAKRRGHLMKIAKPLNVNAVEDGYLSSPNEYTPLPKIGREIGDHQGAYGKCKYRYSGKHSEGNRFIQNNDL